MQGKETYRKGSEKVYKGRRWVGRVTAGSEPTAHRWASSIMEGFEERVRCVPGASLAAMFSSWGETRLRSLNQSGASPATRSHNPNINKFAPAIRPPYTSATPPQRTARAQNDIPPIILITHHPGGWGDQRGSAVMEETKRQKGGRLQIGEDKIEETSTFDDVLFKRFTCRRVPHLAGHTNHVKVWRDTGNLTNPALCPVMSQISCRPLY